MACSIARILFVLPFISICYSAVPNKDIHIHFADNVRSLELLAKDAALMFKRADETLAQVGKDVDNDPQGYFLDFIIEQIAKAITHCNSAPFYPDVCKLEPEVKRLQRVLSDKIHYGKRRHALCKTMGTLAVEIQAHLKYISDMFVKVTNEAFEMVNILEMMEYEQYNPNWKHQLEQAKDDFIDRMKKMQNMQTAIRAAIALVEIAIIALTPPNPVTIILEIISIGIALAQSIKQQKDYLNQLKNAKSSMEKAIADVNRANNLINEECGKLETSWGHLLENGHRTLDNVNAVTLRLREIMPKVYGAVSADGLTFASNRNFDTSNARNINGQTDNIQGFVVNELFPRINGALEDLFGKFKIDQLPTMVWVTHEVVTKVKINATISDIVSEVKPRDQHFTNLQIMHLVAKMFPARKCYQYYPLEPAKNNVNHPTYAIQDINKVATTLQTTLFFTPLRSDCSNLNDIVKAAQRIDCNCSADCACVQQQNDDLHKYIIACLRPDVACAKQGAKNVHVCSGRE